MEPRLYIIRMTAAKLRPAHNFSIRDQLKNRIITNHPNTFRLITEAYTVNYVKLRTRP